MNTGMNTGVNIVPESLGTVPGQLGACPQAAAPAPGCSSWRAGSAALAAQGSAPAKALKRQVKIALFTALPGLYYGYQPYKKVKT
jgi:hypothetical protein